MSVQAPAKSSQHAPASTDAGARGALHPDTGTAKAAAPQSAQGPDFRSLPRVLAVKLDLNHATYWLIRDLESDAAQYFNRAIFAQMAQRRGYQSPPDSRKPNVTRHERQETLRLSGAVYSAVEREAKNALSNTRTVKRILAGRAPLPQRRDSEALVVRGHKVRQESGVRVEIESARFVAYAALQAQNQPGGCWIRLPIAVGTELDRRQAGILVDMASGRVPILKGCLVFRRDRHDSILQLTYELQRELPALGHRVVTIGPLARLGRQLLMRSEMETIDFSHKLAKIRQIKDHWDLVRRRCMATMGRGKGRARAKRHALSRISTVDKLRTYIHQWTYKLAHWCHSQGIGTVIVMPLGNDDWPAHLFIEQLRYKCQDLGIELRDETGGDMADASTARAVTAEVKKMRLKAKRVGDAIRTIQHEYHEELTP